MRFKKGFSNLELEGQGHGIVMGVTWLLLHRDHFYVLFCTQLYLDQSYCIFYCFLSNIRANLLLWYPWKNLSWRGTAFEDEPWPACRQPRWKLRPFGHFGHLGLLAVVGWIIKVMRRHNCYLKMMCGQKKLLNTLFVYDGIKNSVISRYQRLTCYLTSVPLKRIVTCICFLRNILIDK